MTNDKEKPPAEVIEKCNEILSLALQYNDPEKLMFWVRLEGHVNWLGVSAAVDHYRIKIYDRICDIEKGKGWDDVITDLDEILGDMRRLVDGECSYEIKTTWVRND